MTHETKRRIEHRGRLLEIEMRTTASPERVWAAWTDPERVAQWFVDRAEGGPVVGSTFTWMFDEFGYIIPYEVLDAVPNERWALRAGMPGREPGVLEVTIAREGGVTVVRLVNSGFLDGGAWDEEYEGIASGWQNALAILKLYVELHFGEPKTNVLALRPARFAYDELRPYFHDEAMLSRWLTRSGEVGEQGSACRLVLEDGTTVTGEVLSVTPTEAVVEWTEVGGILELKAFGMPGAQRMLGVRVTAWNLDPERAVDVRAELDRAADRLAGLFPLDG